MVYYCLLLPVTTVHATVTPFISSSILYVAILVVIVIGAILINPPCSKFLPSLSPSPFPYLQDNFGLLLQTQPAKLYLLLNSCILHAVLFSPLFSFQLAPLSITILYHILSLTLVTD